MEKILSVIYVISIIWFIVSTAMDMNITYKNALNPKDEGTPLVRTAWRLFGKDIALIITPIAIILASLIVSIEHIKLTPTWQLKVITTLVWSIAFIIAGLRHYTAYMSWVTILNL